MNKIFKKITFTILIIFSIFSNTNSEEKKIKIGMLVPMTGDDKELGQLIIKATRMAIKDIDSNKLEIFPKDTGSNPDQAFKSASEFLEM